MNSAITPVERAAAYQPASSVLPPALDAERVSFGGVNCYVAGSGAPLLLVHSINAVPSAAEVYPLFERYRTTRTVFALELPGFGMSNRADRVYTPRLMTDAIHAVAKLIQHRCGSAPIDALAVSTSCEFMARAAAEQPATWGRLALVSPTGFRGTRVWRAAPGTTRTIPWMHNILSNPRWAQGLYAALTKPGVVRYFLRRTWGGKVIDEPLWAYAVKTARVPGARHAPLYFLSGGLFSADIHTIYESLAQPVWMSHGVRGDFTDYRGKSLVKDHGNWQITVFQTGAMPYFEVPAEFFTAFDAFLAQPLK
jgi:hypothetical protein